VTQLAPMIVVTSHPPRERLESAGWFTRSFASTSGVLLAIGLAVLLACGGLAALWNIGGGEPAGSKDAKRNALLALKRHGIVSLGNEATAVTVDGKWIVSGPGVTREGRVVEVMVSFRTATVGRNTKWQLVDVAVDGSILVSGGEADYP
jgi:hypothetical protein